MAPNKKQRLPASSQKRGNPLLGREDITFRTAANADPYYNESEARALDGASQKNTDFPTVDSDYREQSFKPDQVNAPTQQDLPPQNNYRESRRLNPTVASKKAILRDTTSLKDVRLNDRILATRVIGPLAIGQIPWLSTQFILGVMGTVFFMSVMVLDSITDTSEKGVIGSLVARATSFGLWLADTVGINFGEIALAGYFICYMIILSITLFSLIMIFTVMLTNQLRPLSGQAMSLKYGTLLLVFIGYSLPVVNMFPWLLAYLFVVWLYPK